MISKEVTACDFAPEWVEEALDSTGTATVRRRRLPAEQVVWLVIGMALFRDRPIREVEAPMQRDGANLHWLIRAKDATNGKRKEPLGPGDELVELKLSPQANNRRLARSSGPRDRNDPRIGLCDRHWA